MLKIGGPRLLPGRSCQLPRWSSGRDVWSDSTSGRRDRCCIGRETRTVYGTRGDESRNDSLAVQWRWTAHHHPSDIPWMAQMTGAAFQSRATISSSRATAKRLAGQVAADVPGASAP
jgi:hypothetical protein